MHTITDIENAIHQALNAAPLNAYCTRVETYAGQFDRESPEEIARVISTFPVIYTLFSGSRRVADEGNTVDEGAFTVICAAENLRGFEEAKAGSQGAYQMTDDVIGLLEENDLGLSGLVGLVPKSRRLFAAYPDVCVYSVDFGYAVNVSSPAASGTVTAVAQQIAATLATVTDVGVVKSGPENFLADFKTTLGGVAQIRGWEIERRTGSAAYRSNAEEEVQADYVLKSYLRIPKTPARTVFENLLKDVKAAFNFDFSLAGLVEHAEPIKITSVGMKTMHGLSVHYAELVLSCREWIDK